jgi:signal peptidase II
MEYKWLGLAVVLLILDIIFKLVFKETSYLNTGTLFGIFSYNNLVFIFLTLVLLLIVGVLFYRHAKLRFGLSFVLAGGVGNLIDRFFYGGVLDFIHSSFWPSFNLADAYIVFGIVICLFVMFKNR